MVSVRGDCKHVYMYTCTCVYTCTLFRAYTALHSGSSGFHTASASGTHSVLHYWNLAHEDEEKSIPTRSDSHSPGLPISVPTIDIAFVYTNTCQVCVM